MYCDLQWGVIVRSNELDPYIRIRIDLYKNGLQSYTNDTDFALTVCAAVMLMLNGGLL
jgi:hypothetical protein